MCVRASLVGLQGDIRATAVCAVAMAVRSERSVQQVMREVRARREVTMPEGLLELLEPVREQIAEKWTANRRLLSERGLLAGVEHDRLLR